MVVEDTSVTGTKEVRREGPKAGEEGPLDHGRLRWDRPPLRLELDRGAAGDNHPGDHHPRFQRDPDPPHLLPPRLSAPRDGRVLVPAAFLARGEGGSPVASKAAKKP